MALVFKNRVKETCTAPGVGTVTLLGPTTGFVGFSTIGTTNTTYYTIADQSGNNWEVGLGTWTAGGSYGTLARTTVFSNSLGTTAKIDFSSGTQDVFITGPSERYLVGVTSQTSTIGANSYVTALGVNTVTLNNNAVSLGASTRADYDGLAVGYASKATSTATAGGGSTAVGTLANTSSPYGLSLGYAATVNITANNSIAIGKSATTSYPSSVVVTASGSGLTAPNAGVFIDSMRDESAGSPDKVLKYNTTTKELFYGAAGAGSGTVTNVSVVAANGFNGTVATSTSTPAITLSTSVTGLLQGNGTALSAVTIGSGLTYSAGTLSATGGGGSSPATSTTFGTVYGATGNTTSNVNNTGLGFSHVIGAGVTGSTIIGNNANVTNVGASSYTVAGGAALGYLAKTTSQNGIAIGGLSTSLYPDSIAIGASADVRSQDVVLIGSQTVNRINAISGVGVGTEVVLGGNYAVAIGFNAVTGIGNDYSTAIGAGAQTNGFAGTAIGSSSTAGNNSIAIGGIANATVPSSIVLTASGLSLTALNTGVFIDTIRDESAGSPDKTLKYNTTTKEIFYGTGGGSVSPATNTTLGTVYGATGNTTSNVNNTGLGFDHVIGGSVVNSTIIGNNANVSQVGTTSFTTQGGVAVGRLASATNRNSVVIGANSSALNPESVVIGANATVSGASTVVIGSQSKTTGTAFLSPNSVVVGANASINSSEGVVAIGNNVSVASSSSGVVAIGWGVTVPNDAGGSVAIGDSATLVLDPSSLSAGGSVAILGDAIGDGVVAIGTGSNAAAQSVAIGAGATAGLFSLGLGPFAGAAANGSIVLNADVGGLNAPNTGLFIKPIRDESTGSPDKTLKYNTTTKEVFYGASSSGGVTSVDVLGGTTGLTTSGGPITSSGNITLGGTLVVQNGGTGLTTLATNYIPYGNGTGALASSANLTFDGSNLKVTGTGYSPDINLTDATNVDWNTALGQVATFTFVSNSRTMNAPTNLVNGGFYALEVIQSTGNMTLTWNSAFKWPGGVAPTLSTAAGARDFFIFRSDGTNLYLQGQSLAVA